MREKKQAWRGSRDDWQLAHPRLSSWANWVILFQESLKRVKELALRSLCYHFSLELKLSINVPLVCICGLWKKSHPPPCPPWVPGTPHPQKQEGGQPHAHTPLGCSPRSDALSLGVPVDAVRQCPFSWPLQPHVLPCRTGTQRRRTSARHSASRYSPLHHGRLWKSLVHMAGNFVSFCLLCSPCQLVRLLLLRLLSFWALEFRLPCLHKQNTSPPRSTLPGLCGSSFQATHRDLWGTTGGYSLPWCLDTGPAQWGGYTGAKILQGWVALTHVGRALFLHPWLPNWCLYLLLVHKHIQRWAESHRLLLLNIMHGGSDGQNPVPGEKGNCSPSLKINVPSQRHILEHVWLRCQGIPQCSWDSLDF